MLALVRSLSQAAQGDSLPKATLDQQVAAQTKTKQAVNRLHPSLVKILSSQESPEQIPIIIEWGGQAYAQALAEKFARFQAQNFTQPQQRSLIVATLQTSADEQSRALRSTLQVAESLGLAADVQPFWVSPVIAAKASPTLIEMLSERTDVVQIRPDERLYLEPTPYQQLQGSETEINWNLALIGVSLAQQQLGLDGSGVVVANLDTGVDWQHPALLKKYRGYNPRGPAQHVGNWYVVTNEPYLVPGDSNGHGTHTMGTMVGDDEAGNRTGVAPGARWIAIKLFNNQGYTYESWIHAAFQWVMAPDGKPSLAPDVVNCSWGTTNGSDVRYRADVIALRAAGILPVFSAGNSGPSPYTIGSPASYPESLAVGAVDFEKYIALFSSRGPSPWNEVKPEVVAPGVNIRSTFPGNGYATASGTSMAAPHVAGVAALLLQSDPGLTPEEIEEIILTTAEPLGEVIPNNATGWGLVNAYAAGLRVTDHGELTGFVRRSVDNSPVPFPLLSAMPLENPSQTLSSIGKADGSYNFALPPGRYDLTVSGFGFLSSTIHNISILTGTRTTLSIALTPAPTGSLTGKVTDLGSGAPLSATLSVEGTPMRVQTEPLSGIYRLNLPGGSWKVKVTADEHRTGHITPTITAGMTYTINVSLPSAPRILLVDGGRWYNGSQINYFKDALDALDYPYTEKPIRSLGLGGTPDERPQPGDFDSYDAVIWSDPSSSPGWIGSNDVITSFLKTGGHLLVSGEDILYLDGGGSSWSSPAPYMVKQLGLWFNGEGNLSPLNGIKDSFWEGLQIFLNTPDSAYQQFPDEADIWNTLLSQPALTWSDQAIGGVVAGTCQPYRAFWSGFGLEGSGPRSKRIELLKRILQWFDEPPEPYGIKIFYSPQEMIGASGDVLTQTIQIYNTGVLPDTYNLQVAGGAWGIDIELPDGSHTSGDTTLSLDSCQGATLTANLSIPLGQPRHARSMAELTFSSQNNPSIAETITLRAKTHALLLLVEHQIWYKDIEPYTQTLTALGMPFDLYRTQTPQGNPPASLLAHYPLVIWTTGYNWYSPLGLDGEKKLAQYLDGGGRLLLSSQDLLDVNGLSSFVRDRLGVIGFTLSVTPTQVSGAKDQPFNADLGLWDLTFSYTNWGDGLLASENTKVILEDQNPYPVGLAHSGENWRSSFFSFPLETLDPSAHHLLLSQALHWISLFGESHLEVSPAAAAEEQVPITLTLQLANNQALSGLRAIVPLLPETSLVAGSLQGPWDYDPLNNHLIWEGDLSPGEVIPLRAVLQLVENIPATTILPLKAKFYDEQGLLDIAEAPIRIGVPWLHLRGDFDRSKTEIGETVAYTVTVENAGVISDSVSLTVTLPAGFSLLTETVTVTQGTLVGDKSQLRWSGAIAPDTQVNLYFKGQISPAHPGIRLATSAQAEGIYSRRKVWLVVGVPAHYYFPYIGR